MFEVICVRAIITRNPANKNSPRPGVGDRDEVTGTHTDELGTGYYFLDRFGKSFAYDRAYFALVDGPDETEIAEARAEREGIRLDCELVSLIERIEYA